MEHGVEEIVVAVAVVALAVGAGARAVSKRVRVPYTIAMLAVGLATGLAARLYAPETDAFAVVRQPVSPELILFVFLPALVFESAFSLDVHAFRKNLLFVAVLAGPAMVLAAVGTAGAMVGLTRAPGLGALAWGWPAALVFGALISATDPIAVVALLREVGAPKRLGLLIEGESLLNDGTAIVAFTVLLTLLTGEAAAGIDPADVLFRFARVVLGGVAVGYLLAAAASAWIGRTFADPLVEITVTVVLAYGAMLLAEGLLHVSGVLALVTAGLHLAGPGRRRISPEVRAFLKEFWELLAYFANTLVFFLVGVVVAYELHGSDVATLGLIGAAFVALLLIRLAVIFLARWVANPFLARPVEPRAAAVMAWGGLRGAVSLALALMVATHPDVDRELGRQVLQLTAGVVLLTIVLGGLTTGRLLAWLGFADPSPAQRFSEARARRQVLEALLARVRRARSAPGLGRLPWARVEAQAEARLGDARRDEDAERSRYEAAGEAQAEGAAFRDAAAVERRRYRAAFEEGTLSADGLGALEHVLDQHLDDVEAGHAERRTTDAPPAGRVQRLLARGFGRHALQYEVSRAQLEAARAVRASLARRADAGALRVEGFYERLERAAAHRLEDLRAHLPEVTAAVEQHLAERIALNAEREALERLRDHGELADGVAARELDLVKGRLKRLARERPPVTLRETAELCREAPMFRGLPEDAIQELAEATEERAYAQGDVLFTEGDRPDAAYVIATGVVEVLRGDRPIALLGGGEVVGEMGLLGGERRNATARAASTVTAGRIGAKAFRALLAHRPELRSRIWDALATRALDNAMREGALGELDAAARARIVRDARVQRLAPGEVLAPDGGLTLVVDGAVRDDEGEHGAGALRSSHRRLEATREARVVRLRPAGAHRESSAPVDALAEPPQ